MKAPVDYILHLADNALVLGQRNAEWCGHGPILEEDLALANNSLDLIGQARLLYQHAAEQINADGALAQRFAHLQGALRKDDDGVVRLDPVEGKKLVKHLLSLTKSISFALLD